MTVDDQSKIYRSMSDIEKTAILLSILGEETCSLLFPHMNDLVARSIILQMAKVSKVPHWLGNRIMQDYYDLLSEQDSFYFENNFVSSTIGRDAAKKLMEISR